MNEPDTTPPLPPVYASFNSRMLASAIDVLVLTIVIIGPVVEWVTGHLFAPIDNASFLAAINDWQTTKNTPGFIAALWNVIVTQHLLERIFTENFLQILFIACYTLPFWFRYSMTPGKFLFKLEIRDAKSLKRMTRRQCIVRFLGYIVSALPLTLGFLWIIFNKKRQGWHDLIAGTVVIVKPGRWRLGE